VKNPTTNRVTARFHTVWFWKKEPMWCIMLWITRILTSDHPFYVSFMCCISIVLYQVLLSDDSDMGWKIMHYVFLHFYMLICTSIIVYGKWVGSKGFEIKNWFKIHLIHWFCIEICIFYLFKIFLWSLYESRYKNQLMKKNLNQFLSFKPFEHTCPLTGTFQLKKHYDSERATPEASVQKDTTN
jgi:hypothetical protein